MIKAFTHKKQENGEGGGKNARKLQNSALADTYYDTNLAPRLISFQSSVLDPSGDLDFERNIQSAQHEYIA